MAFNLSDMLNEVSKLDTGAQAQMEYIDIDLIDANDSNFYKLSNLKPLADSIAMDGLQQPLIVMPNGERYTLLSGHRRRAAIQMLVTDADDPREDLRQVPCIKRTYKSAAMAELQLILANSTARVLTSAETMRQAERLEMVLYQLKEEGHEFPGRMRDQVAAACKVSASKLARLKVIREKLIPEYMELFEKNALPEQPAYLMAGFPAEFQLQCFKACKNPNGRAVELLRKAYKTGKKYESDLQCPDGKACSHSRAFLSHDLKDPWTSCYGETCCLNCTYATRDWSPCSQMCKAAKERRSEKQAAKKERKEREKEKQQKKYERESQKNAQRLLAAFDAAGLDDKVKFSWDYRETSGKQLRSYAEGDFSKASVYYGPILNPRDAKGTNLIITSALFGCSTDYLLGITDELKPSVPAQPAGWQQGNPPKACQCVAKVQLPGLTETRTMILAWDGYRWRFSHGAAIEAECKGWIALPEDE